MRVTKDRASSANDSNLSHLTEWCEDVWMDLLPLSPSQPALWLVEVWAGEDVPVPEVDAGVEVQVCSGWNVVA